MAFREVRANLSPHAYDILTEYLTSEGCTFASYLEAIAELIEMVGIAPGEWHDRGAEVMDRARAIENVMNRARTIAVERRRRDVRSPA